MKKENEKSGPTWTVFGVAVAAAFVVGAGAVIVVGAPATLTTASVAFAAGAFLA